MCTLTSAKTSVKVPPRSIEKRSVLPSLAPSIADQTYRWGTASLGTALHLPQSWMLAESRSDAKALLGERNISDVKKLSRCNHAQANRQRNTTPETYH